MSTLPPLSAELHHRDVIAASAEAGQQSTPSPWLYMLAMAFVFLAAMETGLSLAFMASQRLAMPYMVLAHHVLSMALPALLFLFGLWTVNTAYNRIAAERHARQVAASGTPDSVSATYSIEHAGFRLSTPRGEWLAKWISVNQLSRTKAGWVVGNDLSSFFVPDIAFADTDAERAWVRAMMDRMNSAAVAASSAAQAFADRQA
ncbi:MAG: hypothetical protein ACKOUT_05965 [Novosphingobium sp.]